MRYILILTMVLVSLSGSARVAHAETATTTESQTIQQQIQVLLNTIASLQKQLEELRSQQVSLNQELRGTIWLARSLARGMSGDDVRTLQETLATDPAIYPERLVTGFFGSLTEKAVQKFQAKFGILDSGNATSTGFGRVGPRTLSRLNQLLTEGNASGKVPPGLLVAPGIARKLGFIPQAPAGQILPPGIARKLGRATSSGTTTPDTIAPLISSVAATSTLATSTLITWMTSEPATSKVWYATSTPVATSTASTASDQALVQNHSLWLWNLAASTTYYFLIGSTDKAGNTTLAPESSFATHPE